MEFKEYQHIVKIDDPEVDGLLVGKCYIFPKIDGTNSSLWLDNEIISAGSRRRVVSIEKDNQGFMDYVVHKNLMKFAKFFAKYQDIRLYGEWLVPHSLKTYRDDAWRKFYIFDVTVSNGTQEDYIPYETYKEWLDEFELDYITPIRIIVNPSQEDLNRCVQLNTFLIKEDSGIGEGIVVKNYNFTNKYGRVVWGKIVTNEFKEKLHKEMGAPEKDNKLIEVELVQAFLDKTIVDKVYANILSENKVFNDQKGYYEDCEFQSKWIPRLLETTYYDFVREEIWGMVKYIDKEKVRSIDFKNLKQHTFNKVREFYPQLFRRNIQ